MYTALADELLYHFIMSFLRTSICEPDANDVLHASKDGPLHFEVLVDIKPDQSQKRCKDQQVRRPRRRIRG